MPRRNRIILEQRERIIQAFENTNEDYLMVADTIGVNRSTASRDEARNRGLALGHYRTAAFGSFESKYWNNHSS